MATMHAEEKERWFTSKVHQKYYLLNQLFLLQNKKHGVRQLQNLRERSACLGFAYKSRFETGTHAWDFNPINFCRDRRIDRSAKRKCSQSCKGMPTSRDLSENDYRGSQRHSKSDCGTNWLKHTAKVLEGIDLDLMSDEELIQQVPIVDVFARTTPEHKLRIVKALQKMEKSSEWPETA